MFSSHESLDQTMERLSFAGDLEDMERLKQDFNDYLVPQLDHENTQVSNSIVKPIDGPDDKKAVSVEKSKSKKMPRG